MSAEIAEQAYVTDEVFLSPVPAETTWRVNTELSNIISLAEQGLLHTPQPQDKFEDISPYEEFHPLNDW